MSDLPATRNRIGIEAQLGLSVEKGFIALKPDPCGEKLRKVMGALPDGTYDGFRFSQRGALFSVIKLELTTTETEAREAELAEIAAGIEEAWPEKWGKFAVAPEVHTVNDTSQLEEVFFQPAELAATAEATT